MTSRFPGRYLQIWSIMTVSSRIKGRYPQFGLERENEDVEQHDAGGGEFRTGTENETEKGAKGRFDGGHGVFFRKDEFRDEGAEQRTHNHADGRVDEPDEKTDDGTPAAGLGATGKLREIGGYHIVEDGDDDGDREPDEQEGQGHRLVAPVRAAAPEVEEQQAHPAQRRAGQAGDDAPDDAGDAQGEGKYGDKGFHFAKV